MANMRIGGIASGMDTETIIKDLMKVERMPLDKLFKQKTTYEWQREMYREMNSSLFTFKNEVFNMRLQSTFQSKNAISSDESKIKVSANGVASGSYTITKATLATAAYNIGTTGISASTTDKIDPSESLIKMKTKFAGDSSFAWNQYNELVVAKENTREITLSKTNLDSLPTSLTITKPDGTTSAPINVLSGNSAAPTVATGEVYINTETGKMTFGDQVDEGSSFKVGYDFTQKDSLSVDAKGKEFFLKNSYIRSISEIKVVDKDGNATNFTVQSGIDPNPTVTGNNVYVNNETGKLTFGTELAEESTIEASYKYEYFTTSISTTNDKGDKVGSTFEMKAHESLNLLFQKMSSSEVGVTGFYDESTDKVILTRKDTGNFTGNTTEKEMNFHGDSFLTSIFKLDQSLEVDGSDATFKLNGLETSRHSNTFTVNGVTITLKDNIPDGTNVRINVENNTEKVFENIKNFVDKYNELIENINKKIVEPRFRSYQPLTSEERKAMSEDDIKLWEEKAKSGLLNGDPILTQALSSFRLNLGSNVKGLSTEVDSMFDIGLSTSSYESRGKIIIDEKKLKEALETKPEEVMKLFTNKDSETSNQGLAYRLYDSVDKAIDKLSEKAGSPLSFSKIDNSYIGKAIKDLDKRTERFEDRLKQIEDRYWRQFTAMEKAMQEANQQSASIMSFFSGMMQ